MKKNSLIIIILFTILTSTAQQVTTYAGFNFTGYQDGSLETAQFNAPDAACFDIAGNMYIADRFNHKIRKISTTGIVTTIAGSTEGFANGLGTDAKFNMPAGICIDTMGNLYVADSNNHRIRKITPTGLVSTIAGSTAGFANGFSTASMFFYPEDICIDSLDNLFVADSFNNKIRKITANSNEVTTYAGSTEGYLDGQSLIAKFYLPWGVCVDSNFNVYIAEVGNYKIRKITADGVVTTYAGSNFGSADGTINLAQFRNPKSLCIDDLNNVFVVDEVSNNIRKIDTNGNVTTYAGPAGMSSSGSSGDIDDFGTDARFSSPSGICISTNNDLYVLQQNHGKIRKITAVLSAENFGNKKMILFPNPNNGTFYLDFEENILSIVIYNMNGKEVYKETNIASKTIETNLAKGMYLVKITDNNNRTNSIKMIVN